MSAQRNIILEYIDWKVPEGFDCCRTKIIRAGSRLLYFGVTVTTWRVQIRCWAAGQSHVRSTIASR
jgi:hypothetical protein